MTEAAVTSADTLIIGAGPAGLAVAGCLQQRGLASVVLDKADQVASSWRAHYERLHLHTVKALSALPGLPYPEDAPRYVPRRRVVEYMAAYAERFAIRPRWGEEVLSIARAPGGWRTATRAGTCFESRAVVLATGANCRPRATRFAGQADYRGLVMHSRDYRNAAPFEGQRVLVVGMGNTGAEIALDLAEQGVRVALSVRSPVNIVYRDVLGRPTQLSSLMLARLPLAWGDALARMFRDATVGDLSRWGLQTARMSPMRQLREHGKTPVIDVGTVARIKRGEIRVHPGIEAFTRGGVRFTDGTQDTFDAVILATGYEADIARLFPQDQIGLDAHGLPTRVVGQGALAGLYFVGFDIRQPGGLLRAIGQQAQQVAQVIASAAAESAR
jgi:cation diffusion facilitator CzcD-associated flavoprotein CzcO